MAINIIPDDNDIARYAGVSKVDPETGHLNGTAFRLKPGEEYLSVYCLNMLKGSDVSSRVEYLKKDIPLDTSAKGKLSVINIGTMKEFVRSRSEDNRNLTVINEPYIDPEHEELNCDYHCGVRGY